MPIAWCNKCKSVRQPEGDSWCLGCGALEVAQDQLRKRWLQPGLRNLAEECTLNCARFLRALHNLDCSLASGSSGSALLLTAKAKAERPRSRSPLRRSAPPRAPSRERAAAEREASEDYYTEESGEEEVPVPASPVVKREERVVEEHRRSTGRPPEPAGPPPGHKSHKKKKKRGGKRHQKHKRAASQPFRSTHHRLDQTRLGFSRSLGEGLDRRV